MPAILTKTESDSPETPADQNLNSSNGEKLFSFKSLTDTLEQCIHKCRSSLIDGSMTLLPTDDQLDKLVNNLCDSFPSLKMKLDRNPNSVSSLVCLIILP